MAERRIVPALLSAVLLIALATGAAWGRSTVLTGAGDFGVRAYTPTTIARLGMTPVLRGEVLLTPARDDLQGANATFYVDEDARFVTNQSPLEYILDTTALEDGSHVLRVDVNRDEKLIASSGNIPFHIANTAVRGALRQASSAVVQPTFIKLYHPYIHRHIVWFNQREGDLEKCAFVRRGRVYMTLNDLIRHIGGQIEWNHKTPKFHTIYWSAGKEKEVVDKTWPRGPGRHIIMVTRRGKTVQIIPGSSTIIVDGQPASLGLPAKNISNRTYVPLRRMCEIFGVGVEWSYYENRAHVGFIL